MTTNVLERGTDYTLPEKCPHCGDDRAQYLATLRQTTNERVTQQARCVFLCTGCHASRIFAVVTQERA